MALLQFDHPGCKIERLKDYFFLCFYFHFMLLTDCVFIVNFAFCGVANAFGVSKQMRYH